MAINEGVFGGKNEPGNSEWQTACLRASVMPRRNRQSEWTAFALQIGLNHGTAP